MTERSNKLGNFLKDRRGKLDPESFGFQRARRRTPELRREEVAQRANVSVTWYTWLEQGRGGAPSAAVLERVARGGIDGPLQRVLDALEYIPAVVKTATWDVVAQNWVAKL